MFLAIFFSLFSSSVPAGSPQEAYVERYSAIAVAEMHRTGVPASITLAQGLVESAAGSSPLAVKANNHFGIKCHNDWNGEKFFKDDDMEQECFRVYPTPEKSFEDHSDFLRHSDRYRFLFDFGVSDYKAWAEGLKRAGYATDPAYPSKLIDVIERYGLSRFDTEGGSVRSVLPLEEEKADSAAPVGIDEELPVSLSREFHKDGGTFIYSSEGETYRSIADRYGLSLRRILQLNDLKKDTPLTEGTVVYVERKKNRKEK